MSDKTGISWTDATWNPVRGCSRVSEGCRHCYAEQQAARIVRMGKGRRTKYDELVRVAANGEARWTGNVTLDASTLSVPLRWKTPRRVFVNSMSDLFHEALTNEQIAAVFGVMAGASQHTFQVLTKRARRMREWFEWVRQEADGPVFTCGRAWVSAMVPVTSHSASGRSVIRDTTSWPLPNVWLGVSVENQGVADERIPELLATPAAVRFISAEPLLEEIQLRPFTVGAAGVRIDEDGCCTTCGADAAWYGIDWVITGCESGPGARPCDASWLRSLRDQCSAAEVPFFLKQATEEGTWAGDNEYECTVLEGPGSRCKPGGVVELPYLDGVQHAAFPAPVTDRQQPRAPGDQIEMKECNP